jgi:hypothetical protein
MRKWRRLLENKIAEHNGGARKGNPNPYRKIKERNNEKNIHPFLSLSGGGHAFKPMSMPTSGLDRSFGSSPPHLGSRIINMEVRGFTKGQDCSDCSATDTGHGAASLL